MANSTENSSTQPAATPGMPPFYRNPVPLEPVRHARAGLRPRQDFAFAGDTNAITLSVAEFAMAARNYPIVFSSASPAMPFALVGLRDRENLFLDAAGRWREDTYVPAYVRRYPFIFSEFPDSTQLVLCVDEGAENFETESQQPFFVDGKPGPGVQQALQFSEALQAQFEDTRRFGQWLEEQGLLEDRVGQAQLVDGQTYTLRGFRLVNAEKLNALTDEQVLDLHKKGWLPLLHFHLQSLSNWGGLSSILRTRQGSATA